MIVCEWSSLKTLKRQRLYQLLDSESRDLARFEEWLTLDTRLDGPIPPNGEDAVIITGNMLNRISLASNDEIIVELMRVFIKQRRYNLEYQTNPKWSKALSSTPFPYVIGHNLGRPDEYWKKTISEYVKRYYDHDGFTAEELKVWGLPEDMAKMEYNRLWKEQ